jgi:hypothetical protein
MYLRKKFENDIEVEIKIKKASIDDNNKKDQLNKPSVSFKNNVFTEDKTTVGNNPEHIKDDNKHKNYNNSSRDTSKETLESSVDMISSGKIIEKIIVAIKSIDIGTIIIVIIIRETICIIQIIISISNMDKDIIIHKIVEIEFQHLINTKNQQNKFTRN